MRIDASLFDRALIRNEALDCERNPAYDFVDGVVGYLTWAAGARRYRLKPERTDGILRRADAVFARYVA